MGLILFVAELGGGFGHVRRLLPVARAAAAQGHRPLFLTANPEEVSALVAEAGFEVRATPTTARRAPVLPGGTVATSFGDILGGFGFADLDFLRDITNAWDVLLAELRPMAVVCELSPFLCLAALGSDLPVLVLGYGFILPPPHLLRFPPLLQGTPLYSEVRLLETVADVCRGRGRPALEALPALLSGSTHAVTGLDLLDPYRDQRQQPAVGPPALEVDAEPADATDDLFAYLLGDAAATLEILSVLAASGLRGRVYVRRGQEAHRQALARGSVVLLERPETIRQALARARIVVHHGSMLLSEEALAAGRPQLVVPLYLEHLFTARALKALSVATVIAASTSRIEIARAFAATLADTAMIGAARTVAATFWRSAAPAHDLPAKLLRMAISAAC